MSAERRGWFRVLRWTIAAAIVGAAVWLLRDVDFAALAATLRGASWPLVVLAATLNFTLNLSARTLRWRALLPPSPRTGSPVAFRTLAEIVAAAQATNTVVPFRVGEAVRTIALREREGFKLREIVGAQVVEKIVEVASMVTLAIPIVLSRSMPGMPSSRWFVLGGVVAAAAVLVTVMRRAAGTLRPRAVFTAYGWALASDTVDLATIALSLAAVQVYVGPISWCAILVAVNLAIAIPATPGQIGVLEAAAVLALAGLGVPQGRALAFALLYHGVHVSSFLAAGGLAFAITSLRERRARTA
jgi:uncharacterized membrane protein YbhN (UPF0104 family)